MSCLGVIKVTKAIARRDLTCELCGLLIRKGEGVTFMGSPGELPFPLHPKLCINPSYV